MKRTLTIHGRLDGFNDYITACRTNPHAGANFKARNEAAVISAILSQMPNVRFSRPVYMTYRWYEPDRRRDLDNVSSFGRKVIQDALVKTQVLQDDGWKNIKGFSDEFYVDRKHPRIEVEITEVGT